LGVKLIVTTATTARTFRPRAVVRVAITATAPLMIIPMARWIENETISPRARLGTGLAVVGVALTAFFR